MQNDLLPAIADGVGDSLHVAIIMDGNGRWAKKRGLPRVAGHRRGADAVRAVVEAAPSLGVTHLTLFALSSENWRRPEAEISALMGLLRIYLRNEVRKLHAEGVRLLFVGERSRLSDDIVALMEEAERKTRDNRVLTLTIALNYGGRWDIVEAAKSLAERVKAGTLDPADIDETAFDAALQTADLPELDLLVRTSGEQRISNFLLWQSAYTELVFTDVLWPDFDGPELERCVGQFRKRDRRFGALSA